MIVSSPVSPIGFCGRLNDSSQVRTWRIHETADADYKRFTDFFPVREWKIWSSRLYVLHMYGRTTPSLLPRARSLQDTMFLVQPPRVLFCYHSHSTKTPTCRDGILGLGL